MSKNDIAILQTRETIFFSHEDGKLRQLIIVTIENRLEQSLQGAVVVIKAGGEEVITKLGETYPFDAIALVGCYEKKKIPSSIVGGCIQRRIRRATFPNRFIFSRIWPSNNKG